MKATIFVFLIFTNICFSTSNETKIENRKPNDRSPPRINLVKVMPLENFDEEKPTTSNFENIRQIMPYQDTISRYAEEQEENPYTHNTMTSFDMISSRNLNPNITIDDTINSYYETLSSIDFQNTRPNQIVAQNEIEEQKRMKAFKKGGEKALKTLFIGGVLAPVYAIYKVPEFLCALMWIILKYAIYPQHCGKEISNPDIDCKAVQTAEVIFLWTFIIPFFIRISKYFTKKYKNLRANRKANKNAWGNVQGYPL